MNKSPFKQGSFFGKSASNAIEGITIALIILVLYAAAAAMDEERQPVCTTAQLEVQA